MSRFRELTDAELDIVGGSAMKITGCSAGMETLRRPKSCGCGDNLVKELIVDILKILEPCGSNQRSRSRPEGNAPLCQCLRQSTGPAAPSVAGALLSQGASGHKSDDWIRRAQRFCVDT
jgi:hypothetical protein